MKYNNYLKFFDYLNKTDQIEEKFQIIKLNNGKEIKENNLTKKKCNEIGRASCRERVSFTV